VLELQGTINSVKIEIPPGALTAGTAITVREVASPSPDRFFQMDEVAIGNAYSFEPDGLTFNKVVTISFTYRDEDVPPGASEDSIEVFIEDVDGLFTPEGGAQCSLEDNPPPEIEWEDCIPTESLPQFGDSDKNTMGVYTKHLSLRTLALTLRPEISGCNGNTRERPTLVALMEGGFSIPVLECFRSNVRNRADMLAVRRIVLHSTNEGKVRRVFSARVRDCYVKPSGCSAFAHFYISREGVIVQVAPENKIVPHVGIQKIPNNVVSNSNAIGIELFNNVGEPYDGRQIAALIRLMDIMIRRYPAITRDRASIFSHEEASYKCDPGGTFRMSDGIVTGATTTRCVVVPLPGGSQSASTPTLFDAVVAGVSAMGNNFSGLINTSGGDAYGLAQAGAGGDITYSTSTAPIPVGTNPTDNHPLIVPENTTATLAGGSFTDVIVNGTLNLSADATISVGGTLFIGPSGRIITSDALNGNALTFNSNGVPIVNGVIDVRGKSGLLTTGSGGNGGAVRFSTASEGPLLVPTLVTRGGDANYSNCPGMQVDPLPLFDCTSFVAGSGGNIVINALADIVFSGTTSADPSFILDALPAQPTGNLTRLPMDIKDFKRGLLTSGGVGGTGEGLGLNANGGGTGGRGGDISISSILGSALVFRDVDLVTGGGLEMMEANISLPSRERVLFKGPAGSSGGKGSGGNNARGADGGQGGAAGNITLGSGVLTPSPIHFCRKTILGHHREDPRDFRFGVPIGVKVTASNSGDAMCGTVPNNLDRGELLSGEALYRLRIVSTSGNASGEFIDKTIGGSGGIPGGSINAFPGLFGLQGAGGTISSSLLVR
jgi:hypothetical protein